MIVGGRVGFDSTLAVVRSLVERYGSLARAFNTLAPQGLGSFRFQAEGVGLECVGCCDLSC